MFFGPFRVFYVSMCGRFIQISNPEIIKASFFDLEMDEAALRTLHPSYNISPTQDILTAINTAVPKLTLAHWGLIPFWAKDKSIGSRMINARCETLLEKPSFRAPFQKRRCIVFSDGFYEWKGTGKDKEPFFVRLKSGQPFGFAGLWERWTDKQTGQEVLSCTIITTEANELVSRIHTRMPVILRPESYRNWLRQDTAPVKDLVECLKPYDAGAMEAYRITRLVNNPKNDSPECIRPV